RRPWWPRRPRRSSARGWRRPAAPWGAAGGRSPGRGGARGSRRPGLLPAGVAAVGQRPDVGGDEARAGLAEEVAVRGHHAVAALADGLHDRLRGAAVHGVVIGQVGRAQVRVALAVDAVAGHADAFVQALALD